MDNGSKTVAEQVLSELQSPRGGIKTRKYLAKKLGLPDRTVRRAVRELRLKRYPVCGSADGYGYWLGTPEEYEKTVISENTSRIASMAEINRAWSGGPLEGQESLSMER